MMFSLWELCKICQQNLGIFQIRTESFCWYILVSVDDTDPPAIKYGLLENPSVLDDIPIKMSVGYYPIATFDHRRVQ